MKEKRNPESKKRKHQTMTKDGKYYVDLDGQQRKDRLACHDFESRRVFSMWKEFYYNWHNSITCEAI